MNYKHYNEEFLWIESQCCNVRRFCNEREEISTALNLRCHGKEKTTMRISSSSV